MSNSKMVVYTKISPHRNSPRNHKIDTITIHHMAGNLTIEQCGNVFQTREASSNYGIDSNGRVGMYVEEKDRSWCSSSPENDNRAITIEVANDQPSDAGNWHVSDKALATLIDLCVDICQRNDIKKLNYTGDTKGNLTMHKWFAPTGCPGPYLGSKFPYIANEVNKRLGSAATTKPATMYRIRKTWKDAESQIGAYTNLDAAKKACKEGYSVFDENGKAVYTVAEKPKPITYRIRKTWKDADSQIGAYTNLETAKKECKEGYSVFDEKGNAVYTVAAKPKVVAYQRTTKMYTVKAGDTLSLIAEKYDTTVDTILKYNTVKNPNKITVGQKIKIIKDVKVTSKFDIKDYTTITDLKIRNGAGSGYQQKLYSSLTDAQKKKCYKQTYAVLKSGTKVTVKKVWKISEAEWWANTNYGYICLMQSGKKYVK